MRLIHWTDLVLWALFLVVGLAVGFGGGLLVNEHTAGELPALEACVKEGHVYTTCQVKVNALIDESDGRRGRYLYYDTHHGIFDTYDRAPRRFIITNGVAVQLPLEDCK